MKHVKRTLSRYAYTSPRHSGFVLPKKLTGPNAFPSTNLIVAATGIGADRQLALVYESVYEALCPPPGHVWFATGPGRGLVVGGDPGASWKVTAGNTEP